ncbi:MAG: 2-oxoacid:acceptor oxidoreductase family protein [Turicibacter sp.]|nr:2-oxoacid:acceptor oxidoreductase family protein [Turicibacter sp.]
MEFKMVIAGFGGQGVLIAGQLIAETGLNKGKNVSWMPAYGPEMRGGAANCSVIVSDEEIGAPVVESPDVLVAMNQPSLDTFGKNVPAGGCIIYNSDLIKNAPTRDDVTLVAVSCNGIANSVESPKAVNMPILGAVLEMTKLYTMDDMKQTMEQKFGAKRAHLIESNLKAMELGRQAAIA